MLGKSSQKIDELQREVDSLRDALAELKQRYEFDIDMLRTQLIQLANGKELDEDMVRTGRPFKELPAADAEDFLRLHPEYTVLDVRTDEEWESGHIPGAVHIEVNELEDRIADIPGNHTTPVICFCAMGGRSAAACEILFGAGYTDLINVAGGMNGYTGRTVSD